MTFWHIALFPHQFNANSDDDDDDDDAGVDGIVDDIADYNVDATDSNDIDAITTDDNFENFADLNIVLLLLRACHSSLWAEYLRNIIKCLNIWIFE